jgi:hypothetical protein
MTWWAMSGWPHPARLVVNATETPVGSTGSSRERISAGERSACPSGVAIAQFTTALTRTHCLTVHSQTPYTSRSLVTARARPSVLEVLQVVVTTALLGDPERGEEDDVEHRGEYHGGQDRLLRERRRQGAGAGGRVSGGALRAHGTRTTKTGSASGDWRAVEWVCDGPSVES